MSKGFKIICLNCKNEIIVNDGDTRLEYGKHNFSFYSIQSERISIGCNECENDIYIEED